jgi:hypothetical protein
MRSSAYARELISPTVPDQGASASAIERLETGNLRQALNGKIYWFVRSATAVAMYFE